MDKIPEEARVLFQGSEVDLDDDDDVVGAVDLEEYECISKAQRLTPKEIDKTTIVVPGDASAKKALSELIAKLRTTPMPFMAMLVHYYGKESRVFDNPDLEISQLLVNYLISGSRPHRKYQYLLDNAYAISFELVKEDAPNSRVFDKVQGVPEPQYFYCPAKQKVKQ